MPGDRLTVGRAGDLAIDDNPYLHREFLCFEGQDLWWVSNVGRRLAAYLTDERGLVRSRLGPGARLPLVFPTTLVTFAAGETLYELVNVPATAYEPRRTRTPARCDTTISPGRFTESQLLAILALAEPVLRRSRIGAGGIPRRPRPRPASGGPPSASTRRSRTSATSSRPSACGASSGPARTATNRRLHFVEYAVSTLLVTSADLPLLDLPRLGDDEDDES